MNNLYSKLIGSSLEEIVVRPASLGLRLYKQNENDQIIFSIETQCDVSIEYSKTSENAEDMEKALPLLYKCLGCELVAMVKLTDVAWQLIFDGDKQIFIVNNFENDIGDEIVIRSENLDGDGKINYHVLGSFVSNT